MPEMQEPNPSAPTTQSPENQAQGQGPSEKAVQNQGSPQPPMLPPPPFIAPPPDQTASQRLPSWLQQTERLLRVVVQIYVGLIVCAVPWIPFLWDANPLFSGSPWLMDFITHGWLRGLVSGFGLLNLWFALRDALYSAPGPGQITGQRNR